MTRLDPRRLGEGLIFVVIGAAILLLIPSQIDTIPGMETEMPPSFLPTVVAIALMAVGIALAVPAFLRSGTKGDASSFDLHGSLRVLLSIALLVAYALLFPRLGFVVTSGLFMGIFTFFFGARSVVKIALGVILVPVCVWLFFEMLFRIPLPHGILY